MTRWQGMMSENRFSAQNDPAARAAPGRPARAASSPYETTSPHGIARAAAAKSRCSGVAHSRSSGTSSYDVGRPARCAATGGTDPARSRHDPVTTRPVAFVAGSLAPPWGPPARAPACPLVRRSPRGAEPRRRARAGSRRRRAPTPHRRPSRAPRRGVASRARQRQYNRRRERPRHLPSACRGQRADQELRARHAGARRVARAARGDVRRARPHPDGDRRRAGRDGHDLRGRDAPSPRPRARGRREGAAPPRSSAPSPLHALRTRPGRGRRGTSGRRSSSGQQS